MARTPFRPHLLLSLLGCRCRCRRPLLALALRERRRRLTTRNSSSRSSNSGRLLRHDYISSESLALRHYSCRSDDGGSTGLRLVQAAAFRVIWAEKRVDMLASLADSLER